MGDVDMQHVYMWAELCWHGLPRHKWVETVPDSDEECAVDQVLAIWMGVGAPIIPEEGSND